MNLKNHNDMYNQDGLGIPSPTDSQTKKGKWTAKEDDLLRKYVPVYGEKQWRKIAEHIPGRTSIQCLHRWTKILKPGLVKGPWTTEEDQKLIAWVKAEGPTKWAQCANFIKGRSGKQCRERWFNSLNPNVKKGNWSKEEDELIFDLYQKYGSSWSKIAKLLPGRTENAIKNRFYSTLRKLAGDHKKKDGDEGDESHHSSGYKKEPSLKEVQSNINLAEFSQMGGNNSAMSAQMRNTLYKLLQTKTKKEDSDSRAEKTEKKYKGVKKEEGVIDQSNFAKNVDKLDDELKNIVEEKDPDQDEDFERYLISLDDTIYADLNDGKVNTDFDHLQHKILVFCQNNIKDLTHAFRKASYSRFPEDSPAATPEEHFGHMNIKEEYRPKTPSQYFGNRFESAPPTGKSNQSSYSQYFKTNEPKISKPIKPSPQINNPYLSQQQQGFQQPSPSPSGLGGFTPRHHDPMNSNKHQSMASPNPLGSLLKGLGSGEQPGMSPNLANLLMGLGSGGPQDQGRGNQGNRSGIASAQQNILNNLSDILQSPQQGNEKSEETEKKMGALLTQLYSLETLLNSTRTELVKLESSLKPGEEPHGRGGKNDDHVEAFFGGHSSGNTPYQGQNQPFQSPMELQQTLQSLQGIGELLKKKKN